MVTIQKKLADHQEVIQKLDALIPQIESAGRLMVESIKAGGKIIFMGNGGSAADSQHLAAEFVGRFQRERRALPALSISTDTSALTALANDYDYADVFARQVEALCGPQDVVVGISTSGNSQNVLSALKKASQIGAKTVALTGESGGKLKECADLCLKIPSQETARIQEAHILIGHIICEWVEEEFCQ